MKSTAECIHIEGICQSNFASFSIIDALRYKFLLMPKTKQESSITLQVYPLFAWKYTGVALPNDTKARLTIYTPIAWA